MITMKIAGLEKALKKMRKSGKHTEASFRKGLVEAGMMLQAESQRVVPVLTSNLKNSAFTRPEDKWTGFQVRVGYSAVDYAVYVHERVELHHAPGKQAKFLEEPARRLAGDMVTIVRENLVKGLKSSGVVRLRDPSTGRFMSGRGLN